MAHWFDDCTRELFVNVNVFVQCLPRLGANRYWSIRCWRRKSLRDLGVLPSHTEDFLEGIAKEVIPHCDQKKDPFNPSLKKRRHSIVLIN
jgi:hypothetical protein